MNPLLNELLSPRHLEYVIIDENLTILEKSQDLQRFADIPDEVMEGKDLRLAFPEFVGIEDILLDLLHGIRASFCFPAIDRSASLESQLYFNCYGIGNLDEDDFQDRLVILFEDVTERMVLEQQLVHSRNEAVLLANALKNSEAYLEKILSSMAEALIITDRLGKIKRINQTAEQLFGYKVEELVGQSVEKIIQLERGINSNNQQIEFKDWELACQTKAGTEIILAFSCSSFSHDSGLSQEFVYIGRDISDRKQTEAELRHSEAKFRKLAQQEQLQNRLVKDIRNSLELKNILQTTVTEIRHQFNISRCRFFWYRQDVDPPYFEAINEDCSPELNGIASNNPFDLVPDLGHKLLQEDGIKIDRIVKTDLLSQAAQQNLQKSGYSSLLAVAIKTKSEQIGVLTCEHKNPKNWQINEINLLQNIANQLAIAIDQSVLYTQSRFSAMTAKIQAEKLETALADLQKAQSQLIQNEKMSSLGQLVAGIAHEINNPVGFIYGNIDHAQAYFQDLIEVIELYQQTLPNTPPVIQQHIENIELDFAIDDLTKILQSIKSGAERIRQIVLSLRNFSRLDEAEKKVANIHQGIDSTLLVLNQRLSDRRIEVIKEYGNIPLIECYPAEINQVILNLLNNSIDALETNSNPSKQIAIATKSVSNDRICIKIRDNGSGIVSHHQDKLFDPFFTTKQPGKGTGLGLTVCYNIVEKHQGKIQVTSAPGEGTEVVIFLPIKYIKAS